MTYPIRTVAPASPDYDPGTVSPAVPREGDHHALPPVAGGIRNQGLEIVFVDNLPPGVRGQSCAAGTA